jgi:hypothetical protein
MIHDDKGERPVTGAPVLPHLPLQAEPVSRKAVGAAISGDAGVEASDYNDPVYFFINWPSAV